jgi:hypothetical protein
MKWNNTSKVLLIILALIVVLAFATGSRVERLVTDLFTVEFDNGNNIDQEERIKQLEERLKEIEQDKREKELEDKIAELEQKLKEEQEKNNAEKVNPPPTDKPKAETVDLSGDWKNSKTGGKYTIHQFNNKFSFQEVSKPHGIETITAVGEGVIDDKKATISYTNIFGTSGEAILKVAKDGKSLKGKIKDVVSGKEIKIVLERT